MNKFSGERASVSASCGRITTRRWASRVHAPCIAIAISLAVAGVAQAQSNWINTTTSANQSWGTGTNWSPSAVPSAIDAVVNITSNIAADQVITIASTSRTVGTLNIGDPDGSHKWNFTRSGTTAALVFDVSSGSAALNLLAGARPGGYQMNTGLQLNDDLVFTINVESGNIGFNQPITESGGDKTFTLTSTVASTGVNNFGGQNGFSKLVVSGNAVFNINRSADDRALGKTLASYVADAITLNRGILKAAVDNTTYTISANRGITLAADGGGLGADDATRTLVVDSIITGAGGLTLSGPGLKTLNGSNTYLGNTVVTGGTLRINGDQSAATGPLSVAAGALLSGTGTIGGAVSVLGGGTVGPGSGPGTLTAISAFVLASSTSALSFDLNAQNTTIGGGINDLITGVTDLTLAGTLSVAGTGNWLTVPDNTAWRLFNYSGTLTNNGISIGTAPTLASGQTFQIDTSVLGQVNLVIVPEPSTLAFLVTVAAIGVGAGHGLRRRSSPPRSC